MKRSKTSTDARGLTLTQQSAVDLLASGKNDTETATALNLHRVTVTRWRLYSPEFRASLAVRRADIWSATGDRLRALLPKALDTLAEALDNGDDKVTVALAVLKLAGPLPVIPDDPTDPNEIVRRTVDCEREHMRTNNSDALDRIAGRTNYDAHVEQVRERLRQQAETEEALPC